jgi:ribosomal protein L19E
MKAEAARKRREKIGALITISREKMPNTKYDKFYMEELAKKFKSDDHLEEFLEEVKQI